MLLEGVMGHFRKAKRIVVAYYTRQNPVEFQRGQTVVVGPPANGLVGGSHVTLAQIGVYNSLRSGVQSAVRQLVLV